jgi:hypothetical protein
LSCIFRFCLAIAHTPLNAMDSGDVSDEDEVAIFKNVETFANEME